MKIGLYFGSFNPIHIGHLLVATHIREAAQLDEIWFVVSPQNPLKINADMANEHHRLEMINLSIENINCFKAIDIEFHLPKPSYTCVTLKELAKQFPKNAFHLIIGEDNAAIFGKWKESDWILANFEVLVYSRNKIKKFKIQDLRLKIQDLPMFDISSTNIRERVKKNLSIKYFVTENVEQFIMFHKLYL